MAMRAACVHTSAQADRDRIDLRDVVPIELTSLQTAVAVLKVKVN